MNYKQIRKSLSRAVSEITPDIKEKIHAGYEHMDEPAESTSNVWKKILQYREQQVENNQQVPVTESIEERNNTISPTQFLKQTKDRIYDIIPVKKIAGQVKTFFANLIRHVKQVTAKFLKKIKQLPIGKKQLTITAVAVVAILVIVIAIPLNSTSDFVDSVIGIDANPSVEIRTSSSEKVLSVTPLNKEANKLLDAIDSVGGSLDVAFGALIDSMLEQGFISEKKNAVLITVENPNIKKGQALQERLTREVARILEKSSMEGAVIGLIVNEDEHLRTLANEHGISIGKAALVQLLTENNTKLGFSTIAKLDINELCLLLSAKQDNPDDIIINGKANISSYVGEDKARSNAFVHAGVLDGTITDFNVEMDYTDGRMVYRVDFSTGTAKYVYAIDALQGTILSSEKTSKEPSNTDQTEQHKQPTHGDSYITVEEAKASALFHAELSASSVTYIRTYLNVSGTNAIYDIEFISGEYEFDYEIDAYSGVVLSYDHDIENYPPPSDPGLLPGLNVSQQQAKEIALAHAGFAEQDVRRLRVDIIRGSDPVAYEVEFRKDRQQYSYIINAMTGDILGVA